MNPSTLYVGIDVARDRLDVSFLDADEEQVHLAQAYPNRPAGWQALVESLQGLSEQFRRIVCGMESTAVFHEGVARYLREQVELVYDVQVLNPLAVKRLGQAMLRNAKTDKADSRLIAQHVIRMKPEPTPPASPAHEALKEITRRRRRFVEDRSQESNRLHTLLHRHYPGYRQIVGKHLTVSLLTVLSQAQSPRAILAQPVADIARISIGTRRYIGLDLAGKFHQLARSAPSQQFPRSTELLLQMSARRILELKNHIKSLDECIAEMTKSLPEIALLQTIPGIGAVTAGTIVAEVGDIRRFPTKEKFVGYCGLYPIVWESGQVKRKYRMTRQGNRWLKTALLVASAPARLYNPRIAAFDQRLHASNKTTKAAGGALATKLAHFCWAILTKNQPWSDKVAKNAQRKAEAMLATKPS